MLSALDLIARALLEAALNGLWQGALVVALVWAGLGSLRGLSAATRHAVWLVSLLAVVALPLMGVRGREVHPASRGDRAAVRSAPAELLPAPFEEGPTRGRAETRRGLQGEVRRSAMIGQAIGQALPQAERGPRRAAEAAGAFDWRTSPLMGAAVSPAYEGGLARGPKAEANGWRRRVEAALAGWAPLALLGLWLAISGALLARIARSYWGVFQLRRRLGAIPTARRARMQRLARDFGLRRRVRLFASGQVSMPMTVGARRPMILFPPGLAEQLTDKEFDSVIAHELAHIKRWDYVTNLFQRVAQAVFFFHPGVWLIGKNLMIERELACDDWAMTTCEPRGYASCLTKLIEHWSEAKPRTAVRMAATGILFGKHVFTRRVEMILNRDRNATTAVSKPALLYAIGVVGALVIVCSLLSPVIAVPAGQQPKTPKAPTETKPAPRVARPADALPLPPAPAEAPEAPLPPEAPMIVSGLALVSEPDEPILADALPAPAIAGGDWAQDEKKTPAIPEAELLNVLADIVRKDADPTVRQEALQGIYRMRSDAAINALLGLYDSQSDPKIKAEIIGYLVRRNGDNAKAVAKLTSIAKSEPNEELRNRAIRYLGAIRGDDGAANLIQIYDSLQDQKAKLSVIRSLGANKSRKAYDKLIQIAKNDSDPAVRQAAIRSLNSDGRYIEMLDGNRARIGQLGENFYFDGKAFEFDAKRMEEMNKEFQEKNKELFKSLERLQEFKFDNSQIEEMLKRLEIEMPRIELRLKELQDSGVRERSRGAVDGQLRSMSGQLAGQLARMRSLLDSGSVSGAQTPRVQRMIEVAERSLATANRLQARAIRPAAAPRAAAASN